MAALVTNTPITGEGPGVREKALRGVDNKTLQKLTHSLRNSSGTPCLLLFDGSSMAMPTFRPPIESIMRHKKPFTSQGNIAQRVWKEHPQRFPAILILVHGWTSLHLNSQKFPLWVAQYQVLPITIGFRAIYTKPAPNQKCCCLGTNRRFDFVRRECHKDTSNYKASYRIDNGRKGDARGRRKGTDGKLPITAFQFHLSPSSF